MSHHDEKKESHTSESSHIKKSYWEKELEKDSLKEPPMKRKWHWLKPLTTYHALEFRGR